MRQYTRMDVMPGSKRQTTMNQREGGTMATGDSRVAGGGRNWAHVRRHLIERKHRLLAAKPAAAVREAHWLHSGADVADLATAVCEVDMSLKIDELQSREIAHIERALERLGQGRYGRCEECEHQIAKARLEAMPSATMCVKCQSALENSSGASDEIPYFQDAAPADDAGPTTRGNAQVKF